MLERRKYWSDLRNAAWLCVSINIISAMALLIVLNQGLQTNPDFRDRIQFLAQHNILWLFGWIIFTGASLSTLYFFFCFSNAHENEDQHKFAILKLAIYLAIAGIVLDFSAHIIEMLVLPDLAHQIEASKWQEGFMVEQFHIVSRLAIGLTGYGANGLYTIAAALACWLTRNFYPKAVTAAGLLVCAVGLFLSIFSLLDFTAGLFWSNAILIPALLFWQGGIAVVANRHGRDHLI